MTDEEILKAFECCCGDYVNGTHCKDCPAEKYNFDWCSDEVSRQMVDYTKRLQAENAALKERLDKAIELPCAKVVKTKEWIDRVEVGDIIWEWAVIYIDRQGEFVVEPCRSKIAAETRLRELQGENQ